MTDKFPLITLLGEDKRYKGMKKLAIIIFVTVFLAILFSTSFAQSQQTSPGPTVVGKAEQDRPSTKQTERKNDQHGTDNLPLVVKRVEAPTTKTEKGNKRENVDQGSAVDWRFKFTDLLLVIFNGLLAIFTFLLWCSTHKMWKATEKSTEIAYKAFITANRPRLRIRHIHSDPHILPVWVHISNVGGSNATSIELHAVFALRKCNVKEAPWIENLSKSVWCGPTVLAPREEAPYELRSEPDVNVESFDTNYDIATDATLLIIGEVSYKDANQTERKTSFGWAYNLSTKEFSKSEKDDKYNYED